MKSFILNRMSVFLVMALMVMTPLAWPSASAKGWEPVKTERQDAKSVIKENELEIKVASKMIFINTQHPVQIKIFTILGRLVNSETLPPGKSQIQLPASGIYVVQAGALTCKVAI